MIVVLTRLHAGTCVFEAGVLTCLEVVLWDDKTRAIVIWRFINVAEAV